MVDLFSVCWGTSILFSILTLLIYIPINSVLALPFLHILIRICYCLFYNSHFNWEIILHCGFDISIMISDVEHVFICLLAIYMSFFFLSKVYSDHLPIFKLGYLVFLLLSLSHRSALYILDIYIFSSALCFTFWGRG